MTGIALYLFDAYGTLFDVHSAVARHRDAIGPQAERLSELWRSKQLEYSWTRSLMGAYRDFDALTEEALDYAATRCGLAAFPREKLLDAYRRLDAFGDVAPTLARLKQAGAIIGVLSNGAPHTLAGAVESAGLSGLIDGVVSADELRLYKTAPALYQRAVEHFGVAREKISFQSSNRWDIAGVARFGFLTCWINRFNAPDEYLDLRPDRTLASLTEL